MKDLEPKIVKLALVLLTVLALASLILRGVGDVVSDFYETKHRIAAAQQETAKESLQTKGAPSEPTGPVAAAPKAADQPGRD